MSEESDLEKTEPASERRLSQAREDGNVPRSLDATSAAVLGGVGLALWIFSGSFGASLSVLLKSGLTFDHHYASESGSMLELLRSQVFAGISITAPIMVVAALAALLSPFATGGWIFASKRLMPQWSRLNPIAGIGRILSLENLAEFLKTLAKAVLIGAVATAALVIARDPVMKLGDMPLQAGIEGLMSIAFVTFFSITLAVAAVAVMDSPLQVWKWHRQLRMSKEELRREAKEQEGDPMIKARVRQQQRELARRRMMADVPTADVVVTNPTHYAVALKYKEGKMRAPQVVAKGADHLAAKIRAVAADNGVPLLEAPPLARALYRHADVGQEIPGALYTAVAEVLAYVYRLREAVARGGITPSAPEHWSVPAELDPHHQAEQPA
jgi:flagellar biosynthesis protein FlhB